MVANELDQVTQSQQTEEIAVEGFDHIEFYVGNSVQAAYYYHRGFGFDLIGYQGLETGHRDVSSYALRQGNITLVLTAGLSPDSPIAKHVHQHGDGVKCIGLKVKDVKQAYELAIKRGAQTVYAPATVEDENGTYTSAAIKTYGDTIHKLVESKNYPGAFAPGFKKLNQPASGADMLNKLSHAASHTGLLYIDHVVGNVEVNHMEEWVRFYTNVFGFYTYQGFDAKDISTQYSALVSKVMSNKSGTVKLPINEPASGLRKSQIQEYLDYYLAPGVQHIAIGTKDILKTVAELQQRGIDFLRVPRSYYDALPERVGKIDEDIAELARLGILVDRESEGYLLQIFTKPVESRPTLFFEIIQRKGARGFGKGNFQALFESIEREQSLRGNL